jgi:hypothetical protein
MGDRPVLQTSIYTGQVRAGFDPRSGQVGFVVNKMAWGRFSPGISVSPANSHSTDGSTPVYHPGLVQ